MEKNIDYMQCHLLHDECHKQFSDREGEKMQEQDKHIKRLEHCIIPVHLLTRGLEGTNVCHWHTTPPTSWNIGQ